MSQLTRSGRTIGYIWLGNGGQIVLQTQGYQHSFDSAACAANCIGDLLTENGDTSGWDGNEIDDERIDLTIDGMDRDGNNVILIADDDTVVTLAREIDATSGAAAKRLAEMLDPARAREWITT